MAGASLQNAVIEQNDYLPFGTRVPIKTSSSNLYRYSGKEEQQIAGTELAVLDYGARTNDPWLSRWTSIDPLAEKCIRKKRMTKSPSNPVKSLKISPVHLQVQLGSLLRSHRKALHCQ